MSGGSFNNLYNKEISEDTYGYLEEAPRMLNAIKEEYDSPNRRKVADKLERVISLVKLSSSLLEEAQFLHDDIKRVLHAVEWHHSSDWGKDQVEEVLAKLG